MEISDPLFSAFLVKQFDKDKDGRISKAEAEKVTAIRVTENWEIASVEGIASFPNLKTFEFCGDFEHTRPLTGLDVSANTNWRYSTSAVTSWNRLTCVRILRCGS